MSFRTTAVTTNMQIFYLLAYLSTTKVQNNSSSKTEASTCLHPFLPSSPACHPSNQCSDPDPSTSTLPATSCPVCLSDSWNFLLQIRPAEGATAHRTNFRCYWSLPCLFIFCLFVCLIIHSLIYSINQSINHIEMFQVIFVCVLDPGKWSPYDKLISGI